MSEERKRYLSDVEIGRDYRLERNPIFHAYDNAFRLMFEDFNGVPRADHQKDWYVAKRWDSRARAFAEEEDPERRLMEFLTSESPGSRRSLRLIYGPIGCGKTTFIKHFFEVYLREKQPELFKQIIPIIIDCAEAAVSPNDLEQDVDRRTHADLRRQVPWLEDAPHFMNMWTEECDFDKLFYIRLWAPLSAADTEREKQEIIKPRREDPHDFNRVRINYLVKQGYKPVMVWDNLDHASVEVQHKALQLACHKLSWMPGAKVILSVRETTRPLAFAGIAPAAYRVSDQELFPPDVHSVLRRRADTATEYIHAPSTTVRVADRVSANITRPDHFLTAVLESLKIREIEEALCAISAQNVRTQLNMLQHTLRSGHVPTQLIADMVRAHYDRADGLRLSWRSFMEAIICGDYMYPREFGDDNSLVLNVFEGGYPVHEFLQLLVHAPHSGGH